MKMLSPSFPHRSIGASCSLAGSPLLMPHHRPHLLKSALTAANHPVPRTCSTSAPLAAPSRTTRDALYARGVGAPYPPLSSPICAGPPLSLQPAAMRPIAQYVGFVLFFGLHSLLPGTGTTSSSSFLPRSFGTFMIRPRSFGRQNALLTHA